MNSVKDLNKWANAHTYLTLDLVRVALGVFLFMKGILFYNKHTIPARFNIPY